MMVDDWGFIGPNIYLGVLGIRIEYNGDANVLDQPGFNRIHRF